MILESSVQKVRTPDKSARTEKEYCSVTFSLVPIMKTLLQHAVTILYVDILCLVLHDFVCVYTSLSSQPGQQKRKAGSFGRFLKDTWDTLHVYFLILKIEIETFRPVRERGRWGRACPSGRLTRLKHSLWRNTNVSRLSLYRNNISGCCCCW